MTVSAYRIYPPPGTDKLLRLNLGCGDKKIAGFINLDNDPACKPDMNWDIGLGLPYGENSVWEIQAIDLLQCLPEGKLIHIMNICHCVLHPSGIMLVRVPNTLSKIDPSRAISDPGYRRIFCEASFSYFDGESEAWKARGNRLGIKPWKVSLLLLDGDAVIQATMSPVKSESS